MREKLTSLSTAGVHLYLSGGSLRARGPLTDEHRQFIRQHRDQLKTIFSVDVEKYLKVLAVGLPVDHIWLMDEFFDPGDLTCLSLGEYLGGDIEAYRQEIRRYLALQPRLAIDEKEQCKCMSTT